MVNEHAQMMFIFFGSPPHTVYGDNLSTAYDFPLACAVVPHGELAKTVAQMTASLFEQGMLPIKWLYAPYLEETVLQFRERAIDFIEMTNFCLKCEKLSGCNGCGNFYFSEYAALLQEKGIRKLTFSEKDL